MSTQSASAESRSRGSGEPPASSPTRRADVWRAAGKEPEIADVLADPVVHLVMRRDGVTSAQLRSVIAEAQALLARRLCGLGLARLDPAGGC